MTEYIEREAAIDAIMKVYVGTAGYKARERVFKAKEAVHRLPVADVAPVVHGRWVVRFDGPYKRRRCYCSHCGKHNGVGGIAQNQEKPYCPNCGEKMDGGDSDEV